VGIPRGKRPFEDLNVDRSIILKLDPQEVGRGMDWIRLAENRDIWRAHVNAATNVWVP
jgi:hypothetical protein